MSEQRLVLVHRVVKFGQSVSSAAREAGVSRKTAYKWIRRHREDPLAELVDRSRRPRCSPNRSADTVERAVLEVHDQHRWGARKIYRVLSARGQSMPSMRTTAAILKRHQRVAEKFPPPEEAPLRFERSAPNHLWQLDHKGAVEIARKRYMPLAVIDDHSRYCLCDNAFSAPVGLSWFDEKLVRLGIRPIHGRPYHPQTQGKIERFNGTVQRELIDFKARRDSVEHFSQDAAVWRRTYNTLRPHESLGDQPPVTRWQISSRRRPPSLPEVVYPADALLRKVTQVGDIYYHQTRILVGRSLARQHVQVIEREHDIAIYYSTHLLRVIDHDLLKDGRTYKII